MKIMTIKEKPPEALVYNFPHAIERVFNESMTKNYLESRAQWVISDEVTAEVSDEANGGRKAVADRYVIRHYPKIFGNLFPQRQLMIHTETWEPDGEGGYKGSYTCDVQDAPVLVEGEMTLRPVGGGCELRTLHTITAKMPIIGKRVEKYILGQTRAQYGDQLHYLDMRLAGTPDLLPRDTGKYPLPKDK
jgi:hypothetical protein